MRASCPRSVRHGCASQAQAPCSGRHDRARFAVGPDDTRGRHHAAAHRVGATAAAQRGIPHRPGRARARRPRVSRRQRRWPGRGSARDVRRSRRRRGPVRPRRLRRAPPARRARLRPAPRASQSLHRVQRHHGAAPGPAHALPRRHVPRAHDDRAVRTRTRTISSSACGRSRGPSRSARSPTRRARPRSRRWWRARPRGS